MPQSIPASHVARVNPSVISAGGNSVVLNGLMLTQNAAVPIGSVMNFPSAAAVSAFFGAASIEASLASIYFNGFDAATQLPGQLSFFQYNAAPVSAYTRGAALGSLTLAQLQALSGVLTITVDGVAKTSAAINLSAATSFSNAASLIQAAFTSPNFSVSYDSQRNAFVFTSNSTGAASTVSYVSGTLAAGLNLTQAAGAVLSQGAAAATPATAMATVTGQTRNFAAFMPIFEPVTADKTAFAAWNNGQNRRFVYVQFDSDVTPTQTGDTSSFGYQVKTAAYDGVVPVYNNASVAAFILGTIAAIDFTRTNGRITFAFKTQAGLSATVTDETTAVNLEASGYNYLGAFANATNAWNFLYPGSVSGKYNFLDEYVNEIWLNAQLQTAIVTLLTSANSIPYNAQGYGLIDAACADPINAAVNFGAIRPGVPLSVQQAQLVNSQAGVTIDQVLAQRGWYLQIKPATAQVRGQRQSPPCTLWYMDGGSVQQVVLASIVVQ